MGFFIFAATHMEKGRNKPLLKSKFEMADWESGTYNHIHGQVFSVASGKSAK